MSEAVDLGHGHTLTFTGWGPDRELNPQYAHLPDVERFGAIIDHPRPDNGERCSGSVTFDDVVQRELMPDSPRWEVVQWEPLTLSPSILCRVCGDHGFVREGKWVPA